MYSIAEFQKVKSAGEFSSMSKHNFRINLSVADKKRIDTTRSHLNQVLLNPLEISSSDSSDTNKKIQDYFEKNQVEIKSDSVLAVDLILTTSPEFWGEWQVNGKITDAGQKKLDEWVPVQLDFLKKKFGENAVKLAILHLDEKTPHIHIIVTPEETKTLKYKNQYGSQEKVTTSLNAKRWNPIFWKKFLTDYAGANKKFGLKRPIENSSAKKTPIKEFEKLISVAVNEDYTKAIHKLIENIGGELSVVNTRAKIEDLLVNKLLPKLNPLMNSNQALKKLLGKDRALEYRRNKELTEKLESQIAEIEKEKISIAEKKELYAEAINKAVKDSLYIKQLETELNKYKPKVENTIKNIVKTPAPTSSKSILNRPKI